MSLAIRFCLPLKTFLAAFAPLIVAAEYLVDHHNCYCRCLEVERVELQIFHSHRYLVDPTKKWHEFPISPRQRDYEALSQLYDLVRLRVKESCLLEVADAHPINDCLNIQKTIKFFNR